jgi:hypothetical protein
MRIAPAVKRHCPRCDSELSYVKTSSKYSCQTCSNNKQELSLWSIQYLDGYDDCKNKIYKKPSKKTIVEESYGARTD